MGRIASVTYEGVCQAIEELLAQGVRPSVRAVRTLLGSGSMNTINSLFQEWRAKQADGHDASQRLLPPKVQRTVFEFIDQEVTRVHMDLADDLSEARRDMQALGEDNERLVESVEALQAEIYALTDAKAALDGRIAQLVDDLAGARDEAAAERRNAELDRIELARARQRLETLEALEHDLDRLRAGFEAQREGRVQAEKEAAVLQARETVLQERLAELMAERGQAPHEGSGEQGTTTAQKRHPKSFSRRSEPAVEKAGGDSPIKPAETPPSSSSDRDDGGASSQMSLC